MSIYIALENLRSLFNIGAIFRTCSFFNVKDVILVGYSGKTYNLKGKEILHPDILKTSLGSEKDINITFLKNTGDLINFSRQNNLKIISVEQNEKSITLKKWKNKRNSILVFGNENDGINRETLDESDCILEIPHYGTHNSLNVATSVGIVLYSINE